MRVCVRKCERERERESEGRRQALGVIETEKEG